MAEPQRPLKPPPILQKPPGYKDPTNSIKPGQLPGPRKPANLPPTFRPNKKRNNVRFCRICCCICCILWVVVLVLIVILGGLFYVWFDPKLPAFHLTYFKISSFNLTTKPEGSYLDARMSCSVEVRNPNARLVFYYANSKVEVSVGEGEEAETSVGSATMPAFEQGARNTTSLKVLTGAKGLLVDEGVGSRLVADYKRRNLVVNVMVRTKVGMGFGGLNVGKLGIGVLCGGVVLKDVDGGGGALPRCTINALKWINIT